jgi:hypothetical protein
MSKAIDWIQRAAKWRSVFAGWQLGTRAKGDPESDAVRDHREATILLRIELAATMTLMIEKGVCTAEEFTNQLQVEAKHYCEAYERRFPGMVAVDDGMQFDQRAVETMRGWKP